jgi:hypothetical protein
MQVGQALVAAVTLQLLQQLHWSTVDHLPASVDAIGFVPA